MKYKLIYRSQFGTGSESPSQVKFRVGRARKGSTALQVAAQDLYSHEVPRSQASARHSWGGSLLGRVKASKSRLFGFGLFAYMGIAVGVGVIGSCTSNTDTLVSESQSCMLCHNGSHQDDYAGPGMENPHPIDGMAPILCTGCHGGNPDGTDALSSHIPPPPEIGDREFQDHNAFA